MGAAHVKAVRTMLESNHWVILKERFVDEYSTSAYWDIARPDGTGKLTLRFDGGYDIDGVHKRTFDESIGCSVVEHPELDLYFARINRSWPSELSNFFRELNQLS